MIDLQAETPLTFTHAARLRQLHRNGKRPATSTLWRWATAGCRGVRLETTRVGGTLCTTAQAVDRFLGALNGGSASSVSPAIRSRAIDAAERELDAAGVR